MEAMSKHIRDMVDVMKELHKSFGSVLMEIEEYGFDFRDYDHENEEFKRILEASAKFMPNGKMKGTALNQNNESVESRFESAKEQFRRIYHPSRGDKMRKALHELLDIMTENQKNIPITSPRQSFILGFVERDTKRMYDISDYNELTELCEAFIEILSPLDTLSEEEAGVLEKIKEAVRP